MSTALDEKNKALRWFIDRIRMRMLDYEHLNELLGAKEIRDEEILASIEDTISDWNSIPPPLADRTIWDFPDREALIIGTMSRLLMSGAILHFRNDLQYNAGGITVATHDKGGPYKALADQLMAQFQQRATTKKMSENISAMTRAKRGLGSDYGLLYWFNTSLRNALQ